MIINAGGTFYLLYCTEVDFVVLGGRDGFRERGALGHLSFEGPKMV